ncbi:MAG: heme-binding protein [Rhodospirillales bacterium]|jgi:uncharacterized protein GlcG (DUF336 family)|nr:heme-binding protein [Rhodospirillales bacterium]
MRLTCCALLAGSLLFIGAPTLAQSCAGLPQSDALQTALKKNVRASGGPSNGGLDNNMWAAVVDRDGFVCAVTFSGSNRGDQWPGSRVIAAQKANTGNAFSLDGLALSSANLYAATQPGGSLFGLQLSNPIDTTVSYGGSANEYGTKNDPMVGKRIGGINVFGGGLGLYQGGTIIGGLGVSGDTSCADHNVAWRVRQALGFTIPNGVSPRHNDGIIYDGSQKDDDFKSKSGFGHPTCGNEEVDIALSIGAGTN